MNTGIVELSLDVVLAAVGKRESNTSARLELGGVTVNYKPRRVQVLKRNPKCVCCGLEMNASQARAHVVDGVTVTHLLEMGHRKPTGQFIPFTVDHILLESAGGAYSFTNLQTMCLTCNGKKADHMSNAEIAAVRANPSEYATKWVDVPTLLDHLMLAERFNTIRDTANKAAVKKAKAELVKHRQLIRSTVPGSTIVPQPTPIAQNPWRIWWDSRPSIAAMWYGLIGQHHNWFAAV